MAKKIRDADGKEYTVKEKKPFYKKWWFIGLVIIFIAGAFLGGDDEDESPKKVDSESEQVESTDDDAEDVVVDDNEEETEESIEDTVFGVGEKVEFEGQVVEVTDVEYSSGEDFDEPAEGNEYVIVHVRIENNSDEKISYNPFNFSMENSNGQIETQAFTIVDNDTSLSSGELREGGNVEGTIAFEQPVDDGGLKLIFEPSFWSAGEVIFDLQQ